MTLPTRSQQIEHIEKFLDAVADYDPPWSLKQIATELVNGYHDLLTSGIKKGVGSLHVGLAFKSPFFTKVSHVAWLDDDMVWIVDATSAYGWFGKLDSPIWKNMEESTAKAGAPGNNPDWKVGDKVSNMQRMNEYEVIATGDKCVLLQSPHGSRPMPESNANMDRYYKRESDDLDRRPVPDTDRVPVSLPVDLFSGS